MKLSKLIGSEPTGQKERDMAITASLFKEQRDSNVPISFFSLIFRAGRFIGMLYSTLRSVESRLIELVGERQASTENGKLRDQLADLGAKTTAADFLYRQRILDLQSRNAKLFECLEAVRKIDPLTVMADLICRKIAADEVSAAVSRIKSANEAIKATLAEDEKHYESDPEPKGPTGQIDAIPEPKTK